MFAWRQPQTGGKLAGIGIAGDPSAILGDEGGGDQRAHPEDTGQQLGLRQLPGQLRHLPVQLGQLPLHVPQELQLDRDDGEEGLRHFHCFAAGGLA
ncbi:hypothetical protein D3C84_911190 [compost metagenome]